MLVIKCFFLNLLNDNFQKNYDLLYNNDCVIVPEFGAFVLKSHSAYIR